MSWWRRFKRRLRDRLRTRRPAYIYVYVDNS